MFVSSFWFALKTQAIMFVLYSVMILIKNFPSLDEGIIIGFPMNEKKGDWSEIERD